MQSTDKSQAEMSLTSLQDVLISMAQTDKSLLVTTQEMNEILSSSEKDNWNVSYLSFERNKNMMFSDMRNSLANMELFTGEFQSFIKSFIDITYEKTGSFTTPRWIKENNIVDLITSISNGVTSLANHFLDGYTDVAQNIVTAPKDSGVEIAKSITDEILDLTDMYDDDMHEMTTSITSAVQNLEESLLNNIDALTSGASTGGMSFTLPKPEPVSEEPVITALDAFQTNVVNLLTDIRDGVSNLKLEAPKPEKIIDKGKAKAKDDGLDLKGINLPNVKDITTLFVQFQTFKVIKPMLVENLNAISTAINEMTRQLDTDSVTKFTEGIDKIVTSLTDFDKTAKPLARDIAFLSIGLLALSLIPLSPTFVATLFVFGAFVWFMNKVMGEKKGKDAPKNMIQFATGISILAASTILLNFVRWESAIMMVAFVGGINYVMAHSGKASVPKNMIQFASGIGILTLSLIAMNFVSWKSPIMMLGFIAGLGFLFSMKGFGFGTKAKQENLVRFAQSIGILTLALIAMNFVDWTSPLMMLGFIGGLGLVMRLFGGKDPGKNMFNFASGIGVLTLAMIAMDYVKWESVFKMLVFVGGLGLVMRMYGRNPAKQLFNFASGIGVLTLSMLVMQYVNWESIGKMLVFVGGLGLALRLFPKDGIPKMLVMAGGILMFTAALVAFKLSGFDWKDGLTFVGVIAGIGGVMALLGLGAVVTGIGAAIMLTMSISMVVFAGALYMISKMQIDKAQIDNFGEMIQGVAMAFFKATPYAMLGIIGSALFLPIATSGLLAAGMLMAISALQIDETRIAMFGQGIISISKAYASSMLYMIPGLIGATMFLPIATVSLLSASVLKIISALNIDDNGLASYRKGMVTLVDTINEFGIIQLGKTMLKATALIPIMDVGLKMSQMLKTLSESNVRPDQMEEFANVITTYVDSMAKTLNDSVSKIKDCEEGIDAIAKLTGVGYTLVDTIHKMANMEIVEHEMKNGQLVVKSVKRFNPKDAPKIAANIGLMIQALVDPILALVSDGDEMNVGGKKIKNPFSKKNKKGVEFIQKIGEAYKPITEAISNVAGTDMVRNPDLITNFKSMMYTATDTLVYLFDKLKAVEVTDVQEKAIKSITGLVKSFTGTGIKDFNNDLSTAMNLLSDTAKWEVINQNLDNAASRISKISEAIKGIDMKRVAAFENAMKLLVEKSNNDKLVDVLEKLLEVLGLLEEKTPDTKQDATQQTSTVVVRETAPQNNGGNNNQLMDTLIAGLDNIAQQLGSANSKLGGVLKVKPVNGNGNSI